MHKLHVLHEQYELTHDLFVHQKPLSSRLGLRNPLFLPCPQAVTWLTACTAEGLSAPGKALPSDFFARLYNSVFYLKSAKHGVGGLRRLIVPDPELDWEQFLCCRFDWMKTIHHGSLRLLE